MPNGIKYIIMIFDQSKQPLKNMQAESEQLKFEVEKLNQSLALLKNTQTQMAARMQQNTQTFKDFTTQIAFTENAIKKANEQINANAKILSLAKGSLLQNKELLVRLNEQYDALSQTQGSNSKQVKDLNIQIGALSKTIDDQEKKVAKSREAFDFQEKSLNALTSSFDKIKASNKEFGPILDDAAKGFEAMKTGLGAVKTDFQSVGGAIKATGFGLLVLVLQSLVEYFTKNTEGMAKLKGAIAVVGLVIDNIKKVLGDFGKGIVDAISNPAETVKKVWAAVIDNLKNRFKGIKVFFDGLMSMDLKKMGDGAIQMGTGITNGTDKLKTAFEKTTKFITEGSKKIVETYKTASTASDENTKTEENNAKKGEDRLRRQLKGNEEQKRLKNQQRELDKQADDERLASLARLSEAVLSGYAKEVAATNKHFEELKKQYASNKATVEQLEKERVAALAAINKKFQDDELSKLEDYQKQLIRLRIENITDIKQRALAEIELENKDKLDLYDKDYKEHDEKYKSYSFDLKRLTEAGYTTELKELQEKLDTEKKAIETLEAWKVEFKKRQEQKKKEITDKDKPAAPQQNYGFNQSENEQIFAINEQLRKKDYNAELNQAQKIDAVNQQYGKKKLDLEIGLADARLKLADKFLDNILKNTKKDSAIFKAAFMAKKATSIAEVIISTRQAVMDSIGAYAGIPFIGQALGIAQAAFMAAQGASSIAQIVKQKPGYAAGGQFISDGRGALLPGYSRIDNTNAYLRSGEAVVVSEAMRNPWARNLVSAINVAHGGRDFSAPNTGSAYAVGGIFTDGGNAGRYYSQPVNDVKDLANTLAYQLINNFPPIYVDVKDVNTQQSILARTVNRVNL